MKLLLYKFYHIYLFSNSREKAAKEAGVEDDEDENDEDNEDVMGGPFRNINDQIVSCC